MEMQIRKPKETTEWLNRFIIHPLSYRLVRLLESTIVTPNFLSFFGLLSAFLGGCSLLLAQTSLTYLLLAMFCFLCRMIFDAADGQLARAKNKSSTKGTLIDGLCDYLSVIFLYGVIAYLYYPLYGSFIFLLIAVAGYSSALQATGYQLYIDIYNHLKYGKFGAKLGFIIAGENKSLSWLLRLYNHNQLRFFNKDKLLKMLSEKVSLTKSQQFETMLPSWHLLAGNYRYLLLALLINHIWLYFLIEIILLNLALFYLIIRCNRVLTSFC
ncbi:CDP-alcohol phosphatidyltransferase family protein [Legionella cardiaca]|uniref:CDP-alcohol phosphatidyltransferase family protein n=1 Tax=Legionella cardiaca TaxID=1071983 RepID=A0ABY8ARH6_9GAMM|nr:CDP-alcohol phosphatidyltransferase family protein [Legionella cardiaca]WED42821.1 CDP-alcohol phosphatidyltransferase family protein [Legionella cardiaca]